MFFVVNHHIEKEFEMLVLKVDRDESIVIGEGEAQAIVTVIRLDGNRYRLGIHADPVIPVHRAKVYEQIHLDKMVTPQGVVPRPVKPSVENLKPHVEED